MIPVPVKRQEVHLCSMRTHTDLHLVCVHTRTQERDAEEELGHENNE